MRVTVERRREYKKSCVQCGALMRTEYWAKHGCNVQDSAVPVSQKLKIRFFGHAQERPVTSDLMKGGISSSSEQEFGLVRKSAMAVPTNEQLE